MVFPPLPIALHNPGFSGETRRSGPGLGLLETEENWCTNVNE